MTDWKARCEKLEQERADYAAAFLDVWPVVERMANRAQPMEMSFEDIMDINYEKVYDNMILDARRAAAMPAVRKVVGNRESEG